MAEPTNSAAGGGQRVVAVTGAAGYLGVQVVAGLRAAGVEVVGIDVRPGPDHAGPDHAGPDSAGGEVVVLDVRDAQLVEVLRERGVDAVVHLAAILEPPPGMSDAEVRDIDVGGTRNVLTACLAAGVSHLTVASSGAAYGYHPSNAGRRLREDAPLRGHARFAYSANKRDVEVLLADARREHPQLAQLVLRPGTVLGTTTRNQITALFEARLALDLAGVAVPFVLVLDTDVVATIVRGVLARQAGIYNLAGDGVVTLADVARRQGKRRVALPVGALAGALRVLRPLGLARYGPEQVDFLRYRPVLANDAWKQAFPGLPTCTSAQVLEQWLAAQAVLGPGGPR